MYKKNLILNYHQQDKKDFCGAACAQMVLHGMGTPLLDQKNIFGSIQNNNTPAETVENWDSGPTGLTAALNQFNPSKLTRDFVLYDLPDEETVSRKIVWTIFNYQVAPVALTNAGNHWVVVKGFQTDQSVKSAEDNSYAIMGFFINDPQPIISGGPPPPHSLGDRCGDSLKFGIDNQHISYTTWKTDYMVPNQWGESWFNKYIAICDPEPPPLQKGKYSAPKLPFDGKKLMDRESAAKYAEKSMKDFQMIKNYNLEKILKGVKAGDPVLVQRIDKKGEYYYLVPLQNSDKNIHSVVSIDGRFGNYRESCFAKEVNNPLGYRYLDRKKITLLLENWLQHEHKGIVLKVFPKAMLIDPVMVWKPCQESYSPYLPFYVVHLGTNNVYVRIDGEVYSELTQKSRGA
jgi:hypothetical protein